MDVSIDHQRHIDTKREEWVSKHDSIHNIIKYPN